MGERRTLGWLFLGLFLAAMITTPSALFPQEEEEKKVKIIIPDEPPHLLMPGLFERVSVSGNVEWTDSGFDVLAGQQIFFSAEGGISLQQGNPIAYCGPEGKTMNTIQQPIKERPIGALIGRVLKLISIEVDEETGEEKRNEEIELFFIGVSGSVTMPLSGRLFLGVNETVVNDNDGAFSVMYYSR